MKQGDIVTVMALSGEYVGKLVSDSDGITLSDPRMIIASEQGMGFANGIAATGAKDPKSVTFQSYVFVTETNDEVQSAWRQQTSGLITNPKGSGLVGV